MAPVPEKTLIILDTNVLLHFVPIEQIPWPRLADSDEVVIVLPSVVLRELDAKKNGGSDKLKKRAQRVVSAIGRWLPHGKSAEDARISDGAWLRLRHREPAAFDGLDYSVFDDRVVGSALELRAAGDRVVVFTGDITMRIKMEAHGFKVAPLPDEYRLRDDDDQKRPTLKAPRVVPGLYADNGDEPKTFFAAEVGLTAAHLLPQAEADLAALESQAGRREARINFGLSGRRQPTPDDFRKYIEAIKRYDTANAQLISFTVGVTNVGDAPAEDITVRFKFPSGLHVTNHEPEWPERPSEYDLSHAASIRAMLHQPAPRERRDFDLEYEDDSWVAEFRIARLLQTTSTFKELWATIDDEGMRGFNVDARVLVGDPPDTLDAVLNVRIERRGDSG